jgi:hypothetical protein
MGLSEDYGDHVHLSRIPHRLRFIPRHLALSARDRDGGTGTKGQYASFLPLAIFREMARRNPQTDGCAR